MPVDTMGLLGKYFKNEVMDMVVIHGKMVSELALQTGQHLGMSGTELQFLEEAAMLHDIGICRVHAPGIGMHGEAPYIRHGIIGREILEGEGLPKHALICERHIGVGLTIDDITSQKLPLPLRDMTPQSVAEEIICFADLFYSKTPGKLERRKSVDRVREKLAGFGAGKVIVFDEWLKRFGVIL